MSLDIKLHTSSILNDYLFVTGRNGHESMISPQEYLMFRQQAIEEIRQGIFQNNTQSVHTDTTKENKETADGTPVPESTKPQIPSVSSEQTENPISASKEKGKITSITQKKSSTTSAEKMLAQMRLVEG